MVAVTSWIKDAMAATPSCHSKRNQMYIRIAPRATTTASVPPAISSADTVGPTTSVRR